MRPCHTPLRSILEMPSLFITLKVMMVQCGRGRVTTVVAVVVVVVVVVMVMREMVVVFAFCVRLLRRAWARTLYMFVAGVPS